jgi:glycosyltransferase involved in cell wall biosynthesis
MSGTPFVVGFLGRRDAYQVPRALAESDCLGVFLTGAYRDSVPRVIRAGLPNRLKSSLETRYVPDIPAELIKSHWRIEAIQHLSRLAHDSSNRSWSWANRALSFAIRDRARKHRENILTYEPYAWEAFTAEYDHHPKKVLFHFHLHPKSERELITRDSILHPCGAAPWLSQDARPEWDARVVDLWRFADQIICASSFTKSTLVAQGMPPERCTVVPYGIDLPEFNVSPVKSKGFSVLFVGSGIQRKGLHHLLAAWSAAKLPADSKLTVVSRVVDPAVEALLAAAPRVEIRRGVTGNELNELFRTSSLFVMPSILEGFGQVFLEALSHGCPVLGTPNTCLPDLGSEDAGIFLSPVGDVEALTRRLEDLAETLTRDDATGLREEARKLAAKFSWERFRHRLANTLERDSI